MFQTELKNFVQSNPSLVKARATSIPGFSVLKYSKKVFYDGLWNKYLEECRGTIVDASYNIISYPFTKIYNYGVEKQAPVLPDDTMVRAYRKVNGFLVAVTWVDGYGLLISTTGSTDSEYVTMAMELIEPNHKWFERTCREYSRFTFMFECVHRDDPHIIPEKEGMYLLGCRLKEFGSTIDHDCAQYSLDMFGIEPIEYHDVDLGTLKELVKDCKHEGYVFYATVHTRDGMKFQSDVVSAKIKSPYYLTAKWVARNPRTDKLMTQGFRNQIDEEYYPLLDHIRANIESYTSLDEQGRLAWVRNFLDKS